MKRIISLLLLMLLVTIGSGHAETFWTGTVLDGTGGAVQNVYNLDWSSSGSGVVEGGMAGPLSVDQVLTFRYQSYLFAFTDPGGGTIPTPGLNSTYEFTIVAQFNEKVTSIINVPTPPQTVAYFSTLPGGVFYIYNGNKNAVVSSGFGFDDGTLVAKGTIDPDQITFFSANPDGTGLGSAILFGQIDYVNPSFFIPSNITGIRFEAQLNSPPTDSLTQSLFTGSDPGNLAPYTVDPSKDLVLKVDGSSKFIAAPPPPGDCRVTAGGVKDGITVPCTLKDNGLPDPKSCAEAGFDTWGGQAGAQPGIDGNWTHHHFVSSKQSFVFHSNSLFSIACSDPGCCIPACANAKTHQIDFAGIGSFSNQKGYSFPTGPLCFEVHLEDIGEPGPGGRWPSATAPCTHCPGTPIEPGDCVNCTDYYELRIYDSAAHDTTSGQCTSPNPPIYINGPGVPGNCTDPNDPKLFGYFTRSGNVQMHPQNN